MLARPHGGNLNNDKHKGLFLGYNHLNLPNYVSNAAEQTIVLTYTADGEKLTKISPAGTRNYVAGIEYLGANLDAIYHAEGRCTPNGAILFHYEYTLKDHLGNARLNFRANGTAVTFLEEMHYYPFGMLMEGIGTAAVTVNKYKYNGKELNDDLGLNLSDYGARWYDAAMGRWWSVDPLAEKYVSYSPYNYVLNNPMIFVDPDGKEIWIVFKVKKEDETFEDQKVQYKEGKLYNEDGSEYDSQCNEYAGKVLNDLNQLVKDNEDLKERMTTLEKSENIHTIQMTDNPEDGNTNSPESSIDAHDGIPTGSKTKYNPDKKENVKGDKRTPRSGLAHEVLGHGWDADQGVTDYSNTENGIPMREVNAINMENRARAAAGDEKRTKFGGKTIPEKHLDDTHKKKK